MREELLDSAKDVLAYLLKFFDGAKPFLAGAWALISYVMFPDKAFITAACAVFGAMILDILTKYYALRKPHGTIMKAIKAGAISSDNFFKGTKKKLISFLVLMILCGLSYRVTPISGVSVFLGTLVYAMMFLREFQSCIENLLDAGHEDLRWLLPVLRRKQETILKNEGVELGKDDTIMTTPIIEKPKGDDNNATI